MVDNSNMPHPKCLGSQKNPGTEPKTCEKGPKLGFEYLPTSKTSHCLRTACMAFPKDQRGNHLLAVVAKYRKVSRAFDGANQMPLHMRKMGCQMTRAKLGFLGKPGFFFPSDLRVPHKCSVRRTSSVRQIKYPGRQVLRVRLIATNCTNIPMATNSDSHHLQEHAHHTPVHVCPPLPPPPLYKLRTSPKLIRSLRLL